MLENEKKEIVSEVNPAESETADVVASAEAVDAVSDKKDTAVDFSEYGVSKNDKKKKKKERPPLAKLFNPKNLQTEVSKYGYSFSIKKFYLSILAAFAAAIGVGILFKLDIPFILLIFIVCMLCLPSLLLTSYKNMYESKRFHDVSNYMEQLLYSFRRKKKILTSLEDVLFAFESDKGPMRGLIQEAIDYIRTSESDNI